MARGTVMGYRGAMPSATFDTHEAVKRLTDAGIGEAEAEAITATMRDAVAEGVATKADLRAELAALESRLTIRMAAFVLAGAGLTIALLKLL